MALEVELKLRLPEAEQQRLLRHPIWKRAESRVSTRLVNIYYDTPDLALQCNGIALRRRRAGRRWLQTVKCAGISSGGLSQRPEWEQPYRDDFDFSAIDDAALRKRLERARHRLAPVFETNFLRSEWKLRESDSELLVALDRGSIVAKGNEEPLSEIEIELVAGDVMHVFAFARQLSETFGLVPLPWSKAERGYRLFLGTPRAPRRAVPVALDAALSPPAALHHITAACLDHLHCNYEGAAFSEDPEYIHQMRVALRRLRAALRLFRPQLPPGMEAEVKSDLMDVMKSLADARDLDVLLQEIITPVVQTMPGEPRIEALAAAAASRRQAARASAVAHLRSPHYGNAVLRVMAELERMPADRPAAADLRSFVPRQLGKLHRRVIALAQAADVADPPSLHRLRIGIKRLRYATEFFAPLLQAHRTSTLTWRLANLQDRLGQLNDLANAGSTLMACAGERPDLREAVSLIGGWHAQRYAQLLRGVPPAVAKLQAARLPKVH